MPKLSLLDIESDVHFLCLAVKVVSCVIADQLQHADTKPEVSDYGLETASYRIDASMVRYAVDHAAELALDLKNKMSQA